MAITANDIDTVSFSIDRKGYDVDEVDAFLERVSAEVTELNNKIDSLKDQLGEANAPAVIHEPSADGPTDQDIADRDKRIQELEDQIADQRADDSAIAQALIIAQRSADEIVANAHDAADKTREDADDEAARILNKANAEKQRIMEEIEKLEGDREDSRSQYQEMLNDFIASANDTLDDLGASKSSSTRTYMGSHSGDSFGSGVSPVRKTSSAVAAYTTPASPAAANVIASTPKPSVLEKDLSGFGDADDDMDFDDVD